MCTLLFGKRLSHKRNRQRALPRERVPIEAVENVVEARQVARGAGQEIPDHLLVQVEAAARRFGAQVQGFFAIGQGLELVYESPCKPGAQVIAKDELRRGGVAGGQDRRMSFPRRVDERSRSGIGRRRPEPT